MVNKITEDINGTKSKWFECKLQVIELTSVVKTAVTTKTEHIRMRTQVLRRLNDVVHMQSC